MTRRDPQMWVLLLFLPATLLAITPTSKADSLPLEAARFGGEFGVEYPLARLRLVTELPLVNRRHWTFGTGTSLGMERIAGQRVTDVSAAPAFLAALLLTWPLMVWADPEGDPPPWTLWPIHMAQLPQAYLDLTSGDRLRWFVGAGLHGRIITTSALFEQEEDGFEAEQGLLFTPGVRAGFALGTLRFMAIYGRRHWLRESQRWADDGTELRLRVDWIRR